MDELFARKLGNMEVAPPEDGWIRIENELNRRKLITRKYWMAAASLALLLSATATVVYIQTNLPAKLPVTTVATTPDNTLQLPDQQPSPTTNDVAPAPQAENRQNRTTPQRNANNTVQAGTAATTNVQIVAQNYVVEPDNSDIPVITEVLVFADIPDIPEIPVIAEIPAVREDDSNNQNVETATVASTAIASAAIPKYDEISFFDLANSPAKAQSRNRWEMSGQFAPMYSYRAISAVPSGVRKSDFDDAESPLLAYSGGVSLSYSVLKRLSVQTGVYYAQMGQSINSVIPVTNMYAAVSSNNSYTKSFVRTSSGSVTVASNLKSDANTTYSSYFNAESTEAVANSVANIASPAKYRLIEQIGYVEIPLLLRYRIIDRKLHVYVLGGMSANMLVNNNVFVDNGAEIVKGGTILMARPVNYSSTLGFGMGYQISRYLSVGLEPSFRYFLLPYTTSSQIGSNPYSFGLFSGVVYCF